MEPLDSHLSKGEELGLISGDPSPHDHASHTEPGPTPSCRCPAQDGPSSCRRPPFSCWRPGRSPWRLKEGAAPPSWCGTPQPRGSVGGARMSSTLLRPLPAFLLQPAPGMDGRDRGRVSPSHPLLVAPGIHTPAVIRTTGPQQGSGRSSEHWEPPPQGQHWQGPEKHWAWAGNWEGWQGASQESGPILLAPSPAAPCHQLAITLSWGAGHFSPCPEARPVHLYPPASTRGSLASRLAEKWGH